MIIESEKSLVVAVFVARAVTSLAPTGCIKLFFYETGSQEDRYLDIGRYDTFATMLGI